MSTCVFCAWQKACPWLLMLRFVSLIFFSPPYRTCNTQNRTSHHNGIIADKSILINWILDQPRSTKRNGFTSVFYCQNVIHKRLTCCHERVFLAVENVGFRLRLCTGYKQKGFLSTVILVLLIYSLIYCLQGRLCSVRTTEYTTHTHTHGYYSNIVKWVTHRMHMRAHGNLHTHKQTWLCIHGYSHTHKACECVTALFHTHTHR